MTGGTRQLGNQIRPLDVTNDQRRVRTRDEGTTSVGRLARSASIDEWDAGVRYHAGIQLFANQTQARGVTARQSWPKVTLVSRARRHQSMKLMSHSIGELVDWSQAWSGIRFAISGGLVHAYACNRLSEWVAIQCTGVRLREVSCSNATFFPPKRNLIQVRVVAVRSSAVLGSIEDSWVM